MHRKRKESNCWDSLHVCKILHCTVINVSSRMLFYLIGNIEIMLNKCHGFANNAYKTHFLYLISIENQIILFRFSNYNTFTNGWMGLFLLFHSISSNPYSFNTCEMGYTTFPCTTTSFPSLVVITWLDEANRNLQASENDFGSI